MTGRDDDNSPKVSELKQSPIPRDQVVHVSRNRSGEHQIVFGIVRYAMNSLHGNHDFCPGTEDGQGPLRFASGESLLEPVFAPSAVHAVQNMLGYDQAELAIEPTIDQLCRGSTLAGESGN